MYKKVILIIAIIVMLSANVFAADTYGGCNFPVDIDINGSFVKCVQKPVLIEGTTYIPLRAFSDAIGGVIGWDENEDAATMTKGEHSFVFYPGKDYCLADGVKKDYSAIYYEELTFIPVRAVSELMGYDVAWDDFYLTVKITAPDVLVAAECVDSSYTYEDILYLGKIIFIEGRYQPFETKLGIAGTIVNRVKSYQFPNTVKDVILDTKYGVQFPPAHTDKINNTPSNECIIAAKCALGGVNNIGGSLYFIDARSAPKSWAHKNRPYYTTISGMCFYE